MIRVRVSHCRTLHDSRELIRRSDKRERQRRRRRRRKAQQRRLWIAMVMIAAAGIVVAQCSACLPRRRSLDACAPCSRQRQLYSVKFRYTNDMTQAAVDSELFSTRVSMQEAIGRVQTHSNGSSSSSGSSRGTCSTSSGTFSIVVLRRPNPDDCCEGRYGTPPAGTGYPASKSKNGYSVPCSPHEPLMVSTLPLLELHLLQP